MAHLKRKASRLYEMCWAGRQRRIARYPAAAAAACRGGGTLQSFWCIVVLTRLLPLPIFKKESRGHSFSARFPREIYCMWTRRNATWWWHKRKLCLYSPFYEDAPVHAGASFPPNSHSSSLPRADPCCAAPVPAPVPAPAPAPAKKSKKEEPVAPAYSGPSSGRVLEAETLSPDMLNLLKSTKKK